MPDHRYKTASFFIALLALALNACNATEDEAPVSNNDTVRAPESRTIPEDSMTVKLRTALTAIEIKELMTGGTVLNIQVDSIRHEMVSLKDYYTINRDELRKEIAISTDKEKTQKAIAYLNGLLAKAPSKKDIYKVVFHLKANLTGNIVYNESHTKYLKEDLSEIRIVFP